MISAEIAPVTSSPNATIAAATGSRLIRNVSFLAGGQVATWGLSLLWTVFVPRALGPRGMGELTIAYAATGVVGVVVGLGVSTLLVKEIAREHMRATWLVATAILVRAAFILPSAGAIALYIHFARFGGEQAVVIWMATACMTLALFSEPFQSTFRALERMEYLAYADVLSKAVVTVLSIAIVLMGYGVVPVMAVALAMAIVVLILNLYWSWDKFRIDWHVKSEHVRHLVVASLPYWTTGLVLTVYLWIDSVILGLMTSDVVVGYYAVPTKLFATLLFVPVILATAFLPRLVASFRDGLEQLQKTGRPALELVLVLGLPVAAGMALVAKPVIALVYGPAFAPSVTVLIILAVTLPPTYFNIMVNQVLVATNRQLAWTKVMVAAAVINPLLNIVLIRYFQSQQHNGAIGAATSLLATEIGMALAGLVLIPRILDGQSMSRLLRAVAATAGMALVVLATRRFGLVAETAAGAVSFAALAVVFHLLTADERETLRRTASRLTGRALGRGAQA